MVRAPFALLASIPVNPPIRSRQERNARNQARNLPKLNVLASDKELCAVDWLESYKSSRKEATRSHTVHVAPKAIATPGYTLKLRCSIELSAIATRHVELPVLEQYGLEH